MRQNGHSKSTKSTTVIFPLPVARISLAMTSGTSVGITRFDIPYPTGTATAVQTAATEAMTYRRASGGSHSLIARAIESPISTSADVSATMQYGHHFFIVA